MDLPLPELPETGLTIEELIELLIQMELAVVQTDRRQAIRDEN